MLEGNHDHHHQLPSGHPAPQPSRLDHGRDRRLADCLRGQGLEVKDPLPGKGITEDTPEIREAFPACAAEIGDPPSSGGVSLTSEQLTQLLERAKCLRDKGYEITEPTSADSGFIPAEVSDEDFEKCRTDR